MGCCTMALGKRHHFLSAPGQIFSMGGCVSCSIPPKVYTLQKFLGTLISTLKPGLATFCLALTPFPTGVHIYAIYASINLTFLRLYHAIYWRTVYFTRFTSRSYTNGRIFAEFNMVVNAAAASEFYYTLLSYLGLGRMSVIGDLFSCTLQYMGRVRRGPQLIPTLVQIKQMKTY